MNLVRQDQHYPRILRALYPALLFPQYEIGTIADLDPEELHSLGIEGIIFDVDNTLTEYNGRCVDPLLHHAFDTLRRAFNACIISNTTQERREQLSSYFDLHTVHTAVRKPHKEPFLEALAYLRTQPHQTAMIGDRLFTDIYGANRMGIVSIYAQPLHPRSEPLPHQIARAFELFLYGK